MNIAILHFHRIGGSGIVAYEIAKQMVKRGHSIHFVGLDKPFRLINENFDPEKQICMFFHKVNMFEYPVFDYQPYVLTLASQLAEVIMNHEIDVIHSHYAIPHAISAILARDMVSRPVHCVTTLHGTDITIVGASSSMQRITKYSIEKSDKVVSVSHYLKEHTCKKLCIDPDHIDVLHNFIDEDNLKNKFVPKAKIKEKIFVHASNLRPIKAPLDVIEIFNRIIKDETVKDESQYYQLWIIGDGPLLYPMTERAKQLGINSQVRFWGEHDNIESIIEHGNFFLFPSRGEAFGLAALEAMAFGIPVVGVNMGGLKEIITDGVDGILFELGDVDGAVKRILDLIHNYDSYVSISQFAFNKVRSHFSSKKIIDGYERIYQA